jgi:hypothetical protein
MRLRELASRDLLDGSDFGRGQRAADCSRDWGAEREGKLFVLEADVDAGAWTAKEHDAQDRDDGRRRDSCAPVHRTPRCALP